MKPRHEADRYIKMLCEELDKLEHKHIVGRYVVQYFQEVNDQLYSMKYICKTAEEKANVADIILNAESALTVDIDDFEKRTNSQNNMLYRIYEKLAKQGDQTAQEYRAEIKLRYGVPILRRDDEEFRQQYNRLILNRSYEEKLDFMLPPIEMPVTSLMSKEQKAEMLDNVIRDYTKQGFFL